MKTKQPLQCENSLQALRTPDSDSSAADRRSIMAKISNPVGIFTNRQLQFFADLVEQSGEEMDVLGEDASILHPQNSSTFQLTILYVQVKLTTAFSLALVGPVDGLAPFT
mmetsp:Transcript_78534/g.138372  ORF Transcript_78534/g.138372 Transcript_78534/m.138372 type:complete len:110 (+) Transcript_78534:34-363(+)